MSALTKTAPGVGRFTMTPRQRALWPVIIVAAFFEGFDDALINIALPYIAHDFKMTDQVAGYVLSFVAAGTLLAFFASRLADGLGRRRVFLWCVYLYSACSLATAFAFSLPLFIGLQFVARIFLIGCWSTGYVIVCEEFATSNRGTAVGRFQMTAVLGGLLIGVLLPVVMHLGLGWRALYVVGALPFIPTVLLRGRLPETGKFQQLLESGGGTARESFFAVWKRPHTKYLIVMSLVWFFMYFGIKGSLNFFSLRAVNELDWTANMVSVAVLTSTVAGIFIIVLNGKLLDRLGRKRAAALIILVGSVFGVLTFMVSGTVLVLAFNMISVGCLNSFLIVGSTLTNELFPTRLRSNAMAWANNIAGRVGQVLVPVFITTSALWMSLGHAIALALALPLISLVMIMAFLPETSLISIDDEPALAA